MKIVGPIIKLKSEQFNSQCKNLGFQEKYQRLGKIISILESKMHEQGA
jgi:exonuclease VII small subunit